MAAAALHSLIYIYTYVHSIYTSLEPTSVLVGLPLNIISSFSFFFRVSKRKEEERTKGKEKKKNKKKETKIILISFLLVSGRVLERGG